jgi:hydroxymethylglutaryl-CoA lyase
MPSKAQALGLVKPLISLRFRLLGVSVRPVRFRIPSSVTLRAQYSFSTASSSAMDTRPTVRIVEVGPRDGLQNIANAIPTTVKIELIERLRATGLRQIELTSAVSPKAVPQLADNQQVLSHSSVQAIIAQPSTRMPVLVPNVRGLELAMRHGVKEVAVFVSATEGFSRANTNCTVEEGLKRAGEVASLALKSGVQVRG